MNTSSQQLILVDGFSYLYRAFHAAPPLFSPSGAPTGALYGVMSMLRSLLKTPPDYAAFVIDLPGPTFRHELCVNYKANRLPMPDELRVQVPPLCAMVEALGLSIVSASGFEADDVIGTLALAAAKDGLKVTIASGDKDFAQLVCPEISVLDTLSGRRMATDADVLEKFGVRAEQMVDFLALMGDSSDNVLGVMRCGKKTAAKWLAEYGNLDGVMAAAPQIKGKIGENLRATLSRLPLNRELVTIRTDVPLAKTPHDLQLRAPDVDALRELYQHYGFISALRELEKKTPKIQSAAANPVMPVTATVITDPLITENNTRAVNYETVLTLAQLEQWIQRLHQANQFAFDTETDSLDALHARLVGISVAVTPAQAAYIPLQHDYPGAPPQLSTDTVLNALRPVFTDPEKKKIAQHGKYDMHVLQRYGIEVQGYHNDTMLQSFILNSTATRHDLDSLAQRYLGYQTIKFESVVGKGQKQIPFSQVGIEEASTYAAEDADICLQLHHKLAPQLQATPELEAIYRNIEMPLIPILARMETHGVCIDSQELKKQSSALSQRMLEIRERVFALAGYHFNLDSPLQLQALLFEQLQLPVMVKTPKGQPSTNEEALEAISHLHELPQCILEYRRLNKLFTTYTDKLPRMLDPKTGRIHTRYHQSGAATGRLSSSDPNLQNIPIRSEEGRRIRQAFIAPPGKKIVACDYSQIELRIMAHLSEDPGLIEAFGRGADIHRITASEVFATPLDKVTDDQRRAAKAINFGLIYGMSAFGLAKNLGIERHQAQNYIAVYFSRYPLVRDFMEHMRQQARERGYVQTLFGRRLYLDDIYSNKPALRAGAERAAINAPMQGTAADIIKRAMIKVDHWLNDYRQHAQMIMQVHDELVFEATAEFVPTLCQAVVEQMSAAASLRVPLLVSVGSGDNWEQAH